MSKKILFRLAVLLTVVGLVYGMFWFFKVGQVQNQINSFISANSAHILVSDISASGFPLSQKVTIKDLSFTIPNPLLNKKQVVIKNVNLVAKVFSSEFLVSFSEAPTLRDIDGNIYSVEFTSDPEIKVSFLNGKIAKLTYKDSGYRIVDAQKNPIYTASSSDLVFELKEEGDKISVKVAGSVKDVEGFGVVEVYKNVFEKSLMEGIKTGEIVIGANNSNNTAVSSTGVAVDASLPQSVEAPVVTPAVSGSVDQATPVVVPAVSDASQPVNNTNLVSDTVTSVPDNNLVKSNLAFEIEYTLTPAESKKEEVSSGQLPQVQNTPDQHYNRVTKIHNLDFSNPLYHVSINGEISSLADDETPSGSLAVKVENLSNLVNYIKLEINQITDSGKTNGIASSNSSVEASANGVVTVADNNQSSQVSVSEDNPAAALDTQNTSASTTPVTADSYSSFLKRVAASLPAITQEIAAKNPVSKDNIAQFDVRREKNLDFLVNETSLREIVGKM